MFAIVGRSSEMFRLCMFRVIKGAMRRLSYGRARAYFTIILTDYCASSMTNKARGCQICDNSAWSTTSIEQHLLDSVLNPLFYFAIGRLLYVTEKCKVLLKKHLSMCLRFSFLLHVTLQSRKLRPEYNFDLHPTVNKGYCPNVLFFIFWCFCFW